MTPICWRVDLCVKPGNRPLLPLLMEPWLYGALAHLKIPPFFSGLWRTRIDRVASADPADLTIAQFWLITLDRGGTPENEIRWWSRAWREALSAELSGEGVPTETVFLRAKIPDLRFLPRWMP